MEFEIRCEGCKALFSVGYLELDGVAECKKCLSKTLLPMLDIPSGTALGGFRIVRKIGSGGMGDVYLARQVSMDRMVAVKVLRPSIARDAEEVENPQVSCN